MQTTPKAPIALDTSGRFPRDRALPALRPGTERVPGLFCAGARCGRNGCGASVRLGGRVLRAWLLRSVGGVCGPGWLVGRPPGRDGRSGGGCSLFP